MSVCVVSPYCRPNIEPRTINHWQFIVPQGSHIVCVTLSRTVCTTAHLTLPRPSCSTQGSLTMTAPRSFAVCQQRGHWVQLGNAATYHTWSLSVCSAQLLEALQWWRTEHLSTPCTLWTVSCSVDPPARPWLKWSWGWHQGWTSAEPVTIWCLPLFQHTLWPHWSKYSFEIQLKKFTWNRIRVYFEIFNRFNRGMWICLQWDSNQRKILYCGFTCYIYFITLTTLTIIT